VTKLDVADFRNILRLTRGTPELLCQDVDKFPINPNI
jgi:hypothetical protein